MDGLDALRAAAMLLGIMLHAAVAYMPTRMPDLLWPVFDSRQSAFCDYVFWWIHAFRLPVFFVLSGFFAEMLFLRRGAEGFIRHRINRIAIPYFSCVVLIGGPTFLIFAWGWYLTGRCSVTQIFNPFVPFSPEIQRHFFGPAHLWFLHDLILLTAAYWAIRREWPEREEPRAPSRRVSWVPAVVWPAIFAGPTLMVFWGDVAHFVEFNNSFIWDVPRLFYYGGYFTVGILFYRHHVWFFEVARFPLVHLSLATVALWLMMPAIRAEIAGPTLITKFYLAVSVSLASWFSIFGWFAVFVHYWNSRRPTIRYLSDSSYWMYLIHLPVVATMHIVLLDVSLSAPVKFWITTGITTGIGLLSYQLCIRYTRFGAILHGPRTKQTAERAAEFGFATAEASNPE